MDEKDLKIKALLDSVSRISVDYEDKIADLRVQITVQGQAANESTKQIEEMQEKIRVLEEEANPTPAED